VVLAFAAHQEELVERYWEIATDTQQMDSPRFRAACALARYDPANERWGEISRFVAGHLVNVVPSALAPWQDALRRVKHELLERLGQIYRDQDEEDQVRLFATYTLAEYLAEDPEKLFDLLADAEHVQFHVVYERLVAHRERAIQLAESELTKPPATPASEPHRERLARRQANAAVALVSVCQESRLRLKKRGNSHVDPFEDLGISNT